MKNIALRLKEKEHQRALLTVLTVLMLAILFMLLVSLDAPVEDPEKTEQVEEAIEVSFYEVEMTASSSAEEVEEVSASPVVKEEKVETQTEPSTVVTVGESVAEAEEPDHSLGFTQSAEPGDNKGEFGKDKGVDDGEGREGVISTDLGRLVTKAPTFKANAQEEGTIALKIFVDASGKVVRTMVAQEASNSGSTYLINMAREAALTMRYEEKQGVPFEYVGIKLFTFKKV